MRPEEDAVAGLMRFLYQRERAGQTRFLQHRWLNDSILVARDILLRCFGKFVPDFPRDECAEERERNQKRRPSVPVPRSQIAEAEGLDAAPEIRAAVHD